MDVDVIESKLAEMGGFWKWADILDAIGRKEMQMFAVGESFAVTKVMDFPRRRVIDIVLVYGHKRDMAALEDAVNVFKAAVGANGLFASGREGWASRMHGSWRKLSVNYLKDDV
jgi:hypothetical protein